EKRLPHMSYVRRFAQSYNNLVSFDISMDLFPPQSGGKLQIAGVQRRLQRINLNKDLFKPYDIRSSTILMLSFVKYLKNFTVILVDSVRIMLLNITLRQLNIILFIIRLEREDISRIKIRYCRNRTVGKYGKRYYITMFSSSHMLLYLKRQEH
ncbi:hypothetical protein ACJX0J_041800, partial [Zea mays]